MNEVTQIMDFLLRSCAEKDKRIADLTKELESARKIVAVTPDTAAQA